MHVHMHMHTICAYAYRQHRYETKILVRLLEFITSLVQVHQGTTGTGTGTIIVLVPTWYRISPKNGSKNLTPYFGDAV